MGHEMPRRQFLHRIGAGAVGGIILPALRNSPAQAAVSEKKEGDKIMAHTLPDLPYDFNALEPYIDEQTMRIHHGKHHAAYIANLNKALEGHADLAGKSVDEILSAIDKVPSDIRQGVINNGGGHANHSLFWPSLAPAGKGGGGKPDGDLAQAINSAFGGFDKFKEAFTKAATTRFGSGWAWLGFDGGGKLHVGSTANQDSPLMQGHKAILGLDVWEHAYYLNYQNRRPDYIEAWWSVVNWPEVAKRFARSK
jgi:Fe-Mn family superoxide dismutase